MNSGTSFQYLLGKSWILKSFISVIFLVLVDVLPVFLLPGNSSLARQGVGKYTEIFFLVSEPLTFSGVVFDAPPIVPSFWSFVDFSLLRLDHNPRWEVLDVFWFSYGQGTGVLDDPVWLFCWIIWLIHYFLQNFHQGQYLCVFEVFSEPPPHAIRLLYFQGHLTYLFSGKYL